MALIKVQDLARVFGTGDSATTALNGVSFEIQTGEFVAIMGSSGSGKSTLMHLLGLLDHPTSGQYLLDNQDTSQFSDQTSATLRNQSIGFVFQSFHLLARTSALNNVMLPLSYSTIPENQHQQLAESVLVQVGLSHRLHHDPSQLSGGERQRVAIARALVTNPKIILADEPTGNLDSQIGEQVMNLIASLQQQNRTVILVTHEKSTASYTNRVITLKDGQVISDN